MARIFSVRINLDEMFAQLDALDQGRDKLQWLEGFRAGSRGAPNHAKWSSAKRDGASFGAEARSRALNLSQKQSSNAHVRWDKGQEVTSNGNAAAMPPQCQNDAWSMPNPTIQQSNEPKSEGTMGTKPTHPDLFGGMDGDETPIELAKPIPRESMKINFRDWNMSHPRLWVSRNGEQGSLADWTALFDKFSEEGTEAMDETYSSLIETMEAKKKINYSTFIESLNENYEVTP